MKSLFTLMALLISPNAFSCEMPLKPAWRDMNVIYVSECNTKKCGMYKLNNPEEMHFERNACLANVIINGEADTAAIFDIECNSLPNSFTAKTPVIRCYKDLPLILEGAGS